MKTDLLAYRSQLQAKLDAVDAIIADMGGTVRTVTKAPNGRKGRKGKRKMSAAGRLAISRAAKARWAKRKAAGKSSL